MKLPPYVSKILKDLNRAGFESFIVGGAVRDHLLGITPHDYDIATSARPEEVAEIFPFTASTGIRFGTITVLSDSTVEVTTFRKDGPYLDGRRPLKVTYSKDRLDDLKRRDFTINAIGYSPDNGYFDPLGGRADLTRRTIKAVGDATKRFEEDALRILRGIRFLAELGPDWNIDKQTLVAMKKNACLIKNLSKERITEEIIRIVESPYCNNGLKVLSSISQDAFDSPLLVVDLETFPADGQLRLAALVKANKFLLNWLILSRRRFNYIQTLISEAPLPIRIPDLRHLCFNVGRAYLDDWLLLRGLKPCSHLIADDSIFVRDLSIGGRELLPFIKPGPVIGETLLKLAYLVREDQSLNEKKTLLKLALGSEIF